MQLIKKYWLAIVLLVLVAVAGVMIYTKLHPKELPENLVEGTGRIDGDLVNLNTKYPGRIAKLTVDDGTPVKKGMAVAVLKSREQEAQLEAIHKGIAAKKVELEIASTTTPQMLKKAESALRTRQSQLRELEKGIASQKAVVAQDSRDLRRIRNLYREKLIQKEMLEKAKLKYTADKNSLDALEQKAAQLHEAVRIAQSDLRDATAAQKRLQALKDGIGALEAQKQQLEAVIDEMTLRSPLDGFAVEKIANAGEVIGAGMPVATLIDPHSLYLKIFVDTLQNGKIKLHDKAVIFLDAWPDRPIEAEVVRIAQKAEFTPKEVSVRSDRIQRVFAVHLKPLKPDPLLKLGIPAIGVISLDGKGLPKSLNEIPVL